MRDYLEPYGFLVEPGALGLLIAGLGVAILALVAARYRPLRPRRAGRDRRALPPLEVQAGTPVSQIPVFAARLGELCRGAAPSAIRVLDDLVTMGLSLGASDIHVAPGAQAARVTLRVHGLLYELYDLPRAVYEPLVSRVKVLAQLPIFKRATPQDGQIEVAGGRHAVRVSILPTSHGEKVVLRLASADSGLTRLDQLGMEPAMLAQLEAILNSNQGMIVVTGPTGSGKTTTMYACLLHVQETRVDSANIVTLEDPVEFDFPGFSQTRIDPASGMTFAVGLRAVLRQDPDVILVGEIRDDETAAIAVRAAMTGHLIFTTVHADSAAGVFNRVIQMGVEPHHLASAVRAAISQRLCKRLCPDCRTETPLAERQVRQLALLGHEEVPAGPFFTAPGCERCLGKGLVGRVAIYEVLFVSDAIRDVIHDGAPTHRVDRLARESGMRTLYEHGLERARRGDVPLDEVLRVLAR